MNNLTLSIMAALCMLMISCATEMETDFSSVETVALSPRSVNSITISLTQVGGAVENFQCDSVEIGYIGDTAFEMELTYANGQIQTLNATEAALSGALMSITIGEGTNFEVSDLNISLGAGSLSYVGDNGSVSGQASYIIGDDVAGI